MAKTIGKPNRGTKPNIDKSYVSEAGKFKEQSATSILEGGTKGSSPKPAKKRG